MATGGKQMKPVMVVVPQKRTDSSCTLPLVVNGITFDLSSTRVVHLPPTKNLTTPSNDYQLTPPNRQHSTAPNDTQINDSSQTTPPNDTQATPTFASESTTQAVTMATVSSDGRSVSHREVERKRKLKISTCIQQLADCLPYKTLGKVSHGDVLESVVEHIKKLKQDNKSLSTQHSSDGGAGLKTLHARVYLENLLLRELLHLLTHSVDEGPVVQATPTNGHPPSASSTHQSWPVTSLLAATQTVTTVVSTTHQHHTSTHHTSTPTPASIVQPWAETHHSHPFSEVETSHSLCPQSTGDGLGTPLRDGCANRGRFNRYRPYQKRMHPTVHLRPPPVSHDGHMMEGGQRGCGHRSYHHGHLPTDYCDQSHYPHDYQQNVSRDGHVMPYDSYHSHGSVWRPYSEPHRVSGFGLSDILSHSHSEPLHLEPTPSSHVNSSFLVDSLLDDI